MDTITYTPLKSKVWVHLLSFALLCSLSTLSQAAELVSIDHSTVTSASSQIILSLDEKVRFQAHQLPASKNEPNRCYVDLYDTRPQQGLPLWMSFDDAHIAKIRTGIHGTTFRVVLDLKAGTECAITSGSKTTQINLNAFLTPKKEPRKIENLTFNPFEEPVPKILPQEQVAAEKLQPLQQPMEEPINKSTETTLEPADDFSSLKVNKFSTWGWLQGFTAADIHDDPAEDEAFSRLRARLGTTWDNNFNNSYSLQARAAIDIDYLDYDQNQNQDNAEIQLHETYLRLNSPSYDFTLGKQRIRWGKSDQLSPLDSLNPDDLRQSLTLDLEERKIPSWSARLRWYGENIGIETVVSPWFEKSELDYFDSDWALYRQLRLSILDHPALPAEVKEYAANLSVHEQQPNDSLDNMSAAIRVTLQTEQTDFGVSYRYGWETLPTITSFPVKDIHYNGDPNTDPAVLLSTASLTNEQVEAIYKRQSILGFEWETVYDQVGFRGEIAHIDKVAFLTSDLTSQRKPVGHLVTGIDYTSETEWYFNLQASWYKIFDYDENILYFEEDNLSLLGEVRKSIWRGNLELSTKFNYTATDQSSYIQPAINLKYFPNTECEIGVMIFSGDADTLLGSYDQADQVYARIKISF